MEFALSQQNLAIAESVGRAMEKLCTVDRLHRFAAEGKPLAEDLWEQLAGLGLPALLVPEEHDGMGLPLLDAAVVAEELGRHCVPVPFVAALVMGPLALALAGSPDQHRRLLPKVARGELRIGVAMSEMAAGARENAGVTVEQGRLKGKTPFVIDAAADFFIVADRAGALHLVAADAPGVTCRTLPTLDVTRCIGELILDCVEGETLGSGDAAIPRRIIDAGRIVLAADTLGASQNMMDAAVAYAKERRQFGRPIGSFQAVKHMCAEAAAEIEPSRALVWYAAYAFDRRPSEAALMAAHAKAHLGEVGRMVAKTAIEVHGGVGFTDLIGLHYWFKRINCDRQWLGSPERLRREAAHMNGLGTSQIV
jgi:alkylation response protein AidB-like acyl-CoA dehydrogenase